MMWRRGDPETLARVRAAFERAQQRGTDPVAALDQLGLLWTPHKERETAADAVLAAAELIGQTSLRQMSPPGSKTATPLDAQRAVETFLRSYAETLRPGDER